MKKFFVITLLLVFIAAGVYCLEKRPHDFTPDECVLCHGESGSSTPDKMDTVRTLCDQCHGEIYADSYMHPTEVVPTVVRIPADFPLSAGGMITCTTCHNVHGPYETPFGTPSRFLRRFEHGKAFCDICHGNVGVMSEGHSSALGEAHFRSQYIVTGEEDIDPMSKNCIICHDGAFASSVVINAGLWSHNPTSEFFDRGMNNHPIGVDYEAARTRSGRRSDLRPIDEVDRRLFFFNGRIGCGTCHNPYAESLSHLVMPDYRSKLCFSCHMINE
jgi:predicted CXXCH cytochrome family protein